MKKLALLFSIILLSVTANAQRHEFGLFLGTSYYTGDLNNSAPFLNAKPAGGLTYRYMINSRWALRVNGFLGQIEGSDETNPDANKASRNLSFMSDILELGGTLELNFLKFNPGGKRNRFTPYMFGGFAIFHFNPTAEFNGREYELQPLGTEGQGTTAYPDRDPYSLTTVSVPFGLGIKLSLGSNLVLGAEWGMRKTFTDYIDDVSSSYADPYVLWSESTPGAMIFGNRELEDQISALGLNVDPRPGVGSDEDAYAAMQSAYTGQERGDASNKDWYSFAGITLTFKIRGPKVGKCPAYQNHSYYKEYNLKKRRR